MSCITITGVQNCIPILDEIVEEQQVEIENNYTIGVVGYPLDSLANEIVNYWYDQSNWDLDMILTFIAENGSFDVNAVSKTNDYWICQLNYRYNKKWIDDERWSDPMFQAEVCVSKRLAVPDPSKVWYAWSKRNKYRDRIYFIWEYY